MTSITSTTSESKQPEQWTINKQLQTRTTTRTKWEKDFGDNYKTVADEISQSITKEVFKTFEEQLVNAYNPLPSSSHPLQTSYSFNLSRDASTIKELAPNATKLPPFKEWFETVEGRKGNVDYSESASSYVRVFVKRVDNKKIETPYFQGLIKKIGRQVEETVQENMDAFAKKPFNSEFRSKVEWYRQADYSVLHPSSLSHNTDNDLAVAVWIDKQNTNSPSNNVQSPSAQPKKESCLARFFR